MRGSGQNDILHRMALSSHSRGPLAQALQELVLQRIVDFEAKKCGKSCQVTSKDVDAELESIVEESFSGSQEEFDEFLATNKITKPDARRIVRFNLQQEELFNRVTRGVRFTAADNPLELSSATAATVMSGVFFQTTSSPWP